MAKADICRRAASEAVADVEPPRLYEVVDSVLERASMVPAVLTLESAAAIACERNASANRAGTAFEEPTVNGDTTWACKSCTHGGIVSHAAGVQLIYEGLGLTRTLAHEEPWTGDGESVQVDIEEDLEILAADILVARGFYLLARTDAAETAVQTVQSFGRDQTKRHALGDDQAARARELDANLERDILELAVQTGAAAADQPATPRLLAVADEIVDTTGTSFPPVDECLVAVERSLSELEDYTTDRAKPATDP
ncbi:DUF7114 family protein [Natronobacterium gregoryi]|uniref:Uncharacterized protein n=2 Tax=Natronobacterium gregoryi TaxID=44930 RepID=L0AIF3_NATGS|nr:hypothetical protein [Natronobacterium gregoryi]AFZ72850.1 hypothetical protein Natgr_1647 [Natronobacterium gregoryi SP2]ELY69662.1 hypothetical protein C490_07656 [Natronobacterium gregoryi SP2]PLK21921.1 hypothetical protein CYV19_02185 [Natronobacterium gregoryi SP2]SFI65718.1 hypothetical protein SAMN05443661_10313 [Natronobacterium gregoryi]